MIIRWYYKKLGGHYHIRCFSGYGTLGKNGDLVYTELEWPEVRRMLPGIQFIEDE